MTGLWVLLGVLAVATAVGLVRRATDGRVRTVADPTTDPERAALSELGIAPGQARATLLQFSSAFCAPCRATRRVLSEVADMVDGVRHVEIDAEAHLDAVRALGILKTPTTLVLDADARVVQRAVGQPRKPDVIAALGRAVHISDGETA